MDLPRRPVLTVSELTLLIKSQLERQFPDVWLEGEISNFRSPTSGHLYFTLKDAQSQIRAVFFRSSIRSLRFVPKEGLQVIGRGRLSVYEPRGEYQIVLDYLEPKGVGALQLAFEQLKERLLKEGLFDEARKRPIPLLPRRIGIVTSPTGAALRDILKVCKGRFANMDILVAPATVQGERAVPEIIQAIGELNDIEDVEVIIVARGGGSIEDLWAFNDEGVARAIFHSRVPVISAIGHEIDFTIADFVADLRTPTPSAAAERVVQHKEEMERHLEGLGSRLWQRMTARLTLGRTRLLSLKRALPKPLVTLQRHGQRTDELELRMCQSMERILRNRRSGVESSLKNLMFCSPQRQIQRKRDQLNHLCNIRDQRVRHCLKIQRSRLEGVFANLHALSPLAVLTRGYSVTRRLPDRSIVRRPQDVRRGDRVQILLQEGEIRCAVEETDV